MFCTNCGTQVPDDANVCPNCGQPMKKAAAPASTGTQVDLSGVAKVFKEFNYTALDNLLTLIGCAVLLISIFIPLVGRGGTSVNIFKMDSGFYVFQGVMLILLAIADAILLIFGFEKIFLCTAYVTSLAFMTVFTIVFSIGLFEYGSLGFYLMFIATGLIVAGAVMKLLRRLK